MSDIKKVTGCKPCGNQVLIELLTTQEMANTKLILNNTNKRAGAEYQAIILGIGPQVDNKSYGFAVGDRVVISGNAVPAPEYGAESERDKVLVDPVTIKAVLLCS
jgi:co-chaperonin GroES (HSP10)